MPDEALTRREQSSRRFAEDDYGAIPLLVRFVSRVFGNEPLLPLALSCFYGEGLLRARVLLRFREAGQDYIDLNMKLARVQTAFGPTLDFAMSLGMVLLLFVTAAAQVLGLPLPG